MVNNGIDWGESRRCACCGARKRVPGDWGYWYGVKFCCSYKCMRKMRADDIARSQKPKPEKEKKKRKGFMTGLRRVTDEEREEAIRLYAEGMSKSAISRKLDRAVATISDIVSGGTRNAG